MDIYCLNSEAKESDPRNFVQSVPSEVVGRICFPWAFPGRPSRLFSMESAPISRHFPSRPLTFVSVSRFLF